MLYGFEACYGYLHYDRANQFDLSSFFGAEEEITSGEVGLGDILAQI